MRTDNNEDNQKKEKEGRHASMQAIIKYDRETNRLMVLRGPFTVAACRRSSSTTEKQIVDKPFPATAQDRESMSFLRSRIGDSSNNSNQ